MRRINYPYTNYIEKEKFKEDYYNLLKKKIDVVTFEAILKMIDSNLTLKALITSDFSELLSISKKIKKSKYEKNIKAFFIKNDKMLYDQCQIIISGFLMDKKMELNTCHYCNIDFINTVEQHYKFKSVKEFILEAPYHVLMLIKEINSTTAKRIIKYRKYYNWTINWTSLLNKSVYNSLFKLFNKKNITDSNALDLSNIVIKKNHFTLDHVLPKNEYAFLSLSIFNLVPSCYSCNSKFKHQKELTINNDLEMLCPTSENFRLHDLMHFKMKFNINDVEFERKINEIKEVKDVEIILENTSSIEGVDEFIDIFKLQSRYEFHKYISFEMIENRKSYSDSQIKEFSEIFLKKGIVKDADSIKKNIFGKALFEETNSPFEKYRRDIAKQLGLIK